ncbi:MAG: UDP-N-acetylglucosamine diphosphorylase/glucosamine-1-phosphate N-acetyltransferase [Gammaproteobacteria bacterium RIFCSPHIGHO2_12_FULL_45_9]|nr:MAG: UDP-N-acetylglucosamine diphosphorylase/glucosamine-1-phosphate N-acetyltransferase [Gammaproteobacteria bacterium RIFCSPHIGHO2_12_FULL_45_9]
MCSDLPKVLHPLAGIPLLERVVRSSQQLAPCAIHVVYGNEGDRVRALLSHLPVNWVYQAEQKGTAHAVLQALPHCSPHSRTLILYGDVPLISTETLAAFMAAVQREAVGILVAAHPDPTGLGRIVRDAVGNVLRIVEEKDATHDERAIQEINTGIMLASTHWWQQTLPTIGAHNHQKEYYLTDSIALAVAEKRTVTAVSAAVHETQGVNDRWQLAQLERHYQLQLAKQLAYAGVTVVDPARLDIRGDDFEIAPDVHLEPNVILEGRVVLGPRVRIGSHCILKDVTIAADSVIEPFCVIEGATLGESTHVGPFARLRPGTELKQTARVGNFVETKKTLLGIGSKANHLTYLGDAVIGDHVNIGAGTITCNYDGVNKWTTTIEDGVFIGSNTALVAPVTVQKDATIGAGSTITETAPADTLTLARARQQAIAGWKRPSKQTSAK